MNNSALEQFVALVHSCRDYQKQFWHNGRKQEDMRQAIALERRIDGYLEACRKKLAGMPDYKPNPTAKAFFDLVEAWRLRMREYFRLRKDPKASPALIREVREHCKDMEATIDNLIAVYQAS